MRELRAQAFHWSRSISTAPPRRQPQQFRRLDLQHGGELADDLETRIEDALLKLAR
jgi:hypothetical protein